MTEKLALSVTQNSGCLVGGVAEEDKRTVKRIPRMRTASKIVAEIKALDPGSEVTEYFVWQLVKDGAVKPTWAGNKALINLDDVLDILWAGTARTQDREGYATHAIRYHRAPSTLKKWKHYNMSEPNAV